MPGTRKLGKTTDQRMAMLRQQVTDFLGEYVAPVLEANAAALSKKETELKV